MAEEQTNAQKAADEQWEKAKKDIPRHDAEFEANKRAEESGK